jgi:hypothetical protein
MIFTSTSVNHTFTVPSGGLNCDVLMIGGGGGGNGYFGGTGAGACIVAINQTLPAGQCLIYVGNGGNATTGANGGDSFIKVDNADRYRAKGGGGTGDNIAGVPGGCGCGAGAVAGYGFSSRKDGAPALSTNIVNGSLANIGPSITSTYAVLGNKGGDNEEHTGNSTNANSKWACAGGGGIGESGLNHPLGQLNGSRGGNGAYQVTLTTSPTTTINFRHYFANGSTSFGVQDGTTGNYYIGGGGGGYAWQNPYGAGGLGGGSFSGANGLAGAPNTGSGATNTGQEASASTAFGGSGIVIIRYRNSSTSITTYTHAPTITTTLSTPALGNSAIELVRGTQGDANTDYKIGNYNGDFIVKSSVSNTDTDRLNITPAGNVGIGITSPQVKLHINGEIYATGNIIAYFSDERLKTKIANINNPIEIIRKLNGFYYIPNDLARFNGITNTDLEIGLSAQEVQRVLPEIVKIAPFDSVRNAEGVIVSKSGENYLTMSYERLTPVFVEAIKELKRRNTVLSQEITLIREKIRVICDK